MSGPVLESLSEQECLDLLSGVKYGRVAVVTHEGRPEIFPVNFALRGRTVVFITGSAVMQARAPLGHIAFEADDIDAASRGLGCRRQRRGRRHHGFRRYSITNRTERADRGVGSGA